MGNLKKIIVIIIVVALIGGIGFYFYSQNKSNEDLEKEIIPIAEDYFSKYMSANTGSNAYKVTLGDLKESGDYNLHQFDNCNKDTAVYLTINHKTGKISKTEVKLNCK